MHPSHQAVEQEVAYRAVTVGRAKLVPLLTVEQVVGRLHPAGKAAVAGSGTEASLSQRPGPLSAATRTARQARAAAADVGPLTAAAAARTPSQHSGAKASGAGPAQVAARATAAAASATLAVDASSAAVAKPVVVAFGRRVEAVVARPTQPAAPR